MAKNQNKTTREADLNSPKDTNPNNWKPVPKRDVHVAEKKNNKHTISADALSQMVSANADRLNDSRGIMDLLPDVELIDELLTASILSPKDLSDVRLTLMMRNGNIPGFASAIESYFQHDYPLEGKLSKILSDALVREGACPMFPVPPALIHRLIGDNTYTIEELDSGIFNGSQIPGESLGLLAGSESNVVQYAMESLSVEVPSSFDVNGLDRSATGHADIVAAYDYTSSTDERPVGKQGITGLVTLTDNPMALLHPIVREAAKDSQREAKVKEWYSTEAYVPTNKDDKKHLEPIRRFFKSQREVVLGSNDVSETPTQYAEIFDDVAPPVLILPAESVVPVTRPGEVETAIGYYIAIDPSGNPVSKAKDSNFFKGLKQKLQNNVKSEGFDKSYEKHVGYMTDVSDHGQLNDNSAYEMELDRELREAVEKGSHSDTVELRAPTEFYRLMLSRQLRGQRTKLLYVPAELMTYVAFNYDSKGVGISLIQKNKLFAQLRAVLTFAYTLAGIKNSVGSRQINITLDEDDPDGRLTVETLLAEYHNLQSTNSILTSGTPSDIFSSLQKMQVSVSIDGGDVLPNTKMEVSEAQRDVGKPDTDLEETLKKLHYAGLWTTVEQVDRSYEGDFATGLAQSNLLTARRHLKAQKQFEIQISDFIRKYIQAGGPLHKKLRDLYDAAGTAAGETFEEVLKGVYISLPKPDMAKLDVHQTSLDQYSDIIDKSLEYYINADMYADILEGDHTGASIESLTLQVKAQLMREYMAEKNILPAVTNLFAEVDGELSDKLIESTKSIQEIIRKVVGKIKPLDIKDDLKIQDKIDKSEQKTQDKIDSGEEDDDSTNTTDDTVVTPEPDTTVVVDEGDAVEAPPEDDLEG